MFRVGWSAKEQKCEADRLDPNVVFLGGCYDFAER
jgi:hypothetical protein